MEKAAKPPSVLDTSLQQVGEVYARALLGLAQARGAVDPILSELTAFDDAVNALPKLRSALSSPRVPTADKERMVRKALEHRCSREFLNFALLLARKGRFACLPAVRRAALAMQDEMAGRVRAQVTAAAEISQAAQDKLAARLSQLLGKQVLVSAQVDPAVIGGVVVRVGDTVYDASVANQLRQIKTRTVKRTADSIRQSLERFAVDA